jgi:hypothetical protein
MCATTTSFTQGTTTATINQRAVTIAGITALDKTYDGNDIAQVDVSNATFGLIQGDSVTISVDGTFDSKNVAWSNNAVTSQTVNLTNYSFGGAHAGNYDFTGQASTTATITPQTITVSGLTASDKTYDGNASATIVTTGATFTGIVTGESFTVSANGEFRNTLNTALIRTWV